MKGKIKKLKNGNEYAYPITVSEAVYINESTSLATFLDNSGGVWSYVLDLKRWGVRNDIEDLAVICEELYRVTFFATTTVLPHVNLGGSAAATFVAPALE